MSTHCRGCGKELPKDRKGNQQYCEDKAGIPYCNMFGPLSERSRQILINKEVPYDKVIPGAELPKKEYK